MVCLNALSILISLEVFTTFTDEVGFQVRPRAYFCYQNSFPLLNTLQMQLLIYRFGNSIVFQNLKIFFGLAISQDPIKVQDTINDKI